METPRPPIIIPMWITGMPLSIFHQGNYSQLMMLPMMSVLKRVGFDKLMPEGRSPPFNFMPRVPPFVSPVPISITFGSPIDPADITNALEEPQSPSSVLLSRPIQNERPDASWVTAKTGASTMGGEEERRRGVIRARVTEVVQNAVENLGRQVSGDMLGADLGEP